MLNITSLAERDHCDVTDCFLGRVRLTLFGRVAVDAQALALGGEEEDDVTRWRRAAVEHAALDRVRVVVFRVLPCNQTRFSDARLIMMKFSLVPASSPACGNIPSFTYSDISASSI